MRSELFKEIRDLLNSKVPELKWIDMDWGQLDLPDQSYPLLFDCALIGFPDIDWKTGSRKLQDGDVQILVKIGVDVFNDTYVAGNISAPDVQYALSKMQLVDRIFAVLQGFEGTFFNKLDRIKSSEDKRQDGLKVFQELYMTRMRDTSAIKLVTPVQANLKTTGTFVQSID